MTGTIADPNNNDSARSGGGQVWTIINQGVIAETGTAPSYGIRVLSGGDITNSGTISGTGVGIRLATTATLNNSGTVIGVAALALSFDSGGTLVNQATGLIQGGNGGLGVFGTVGTVSNFGTILAGGSAGLPAVRIPTNNGTATSFVVNGTPGSSALIRGPGGVGLAGNATLTNYGSNRRDRDKRHRSLAAVRRHRHKQPVRADSGSQHRRRADRHRRRADEFWHDRGNHRGLSLRR